MDFLHFLKDISPVLVFLTFMKTAYEFIKGLKWKKSEYLSKEIKEFFSDSNVKIACLLLDYNIRKIEINGKIQIITDDTLISALKTHRVKQSFTTDEADIRDIFDIFFDKLSYFNIHIKNELVEKRQVLTYLSYYLDILSNPERKPQELVEIFSDYINYYEYHNVRELIKLQRDQKNKRFLSVTNKVRNFILYLKSS